MTTPALFLLLAITSIHGAKWDYSGVEPYGNWTANFPTCGGMSQSPINIDSDTAVPMDYSSFSFSIGYRVQQSGILENDGHSIKYSVDESYGASISGGPLSESYTLNQFHLHWGSQPGQGSEHTLDEQSFDAELHLVHYKSTYDNISAAVADGQPDSLAVVGIFMREVGPFDQFSGVKDSESVDNLRAAALKLSRPFRGPASPTVDLEVVLDQFVSSLSDLQGLYHYTGSLTTPGCAEIVQWIVLDTPMHVRENGLITALRKNVDAEGNMLYDNYRPTQDINSRTVYHGR